VGEAGFEPAIPGRVKAQHTVLVRNPGVCRLAIGYTDVVFKRTRAYAPFYGYAGGRIL